jgi:hypothetical protein
MTREQYEFLLPYREYMRLATDAGYIRGVRQADMRKVSDIYADVVPGVNRYACRSCVRDMTVKFRELYPYFLEYERTATKTPGTDAAPVKRSKKTAAPVKA